MHVPARLTHQTAPTSLFSIEMRRLFLREKINQRLFAFRNYGKEPYCGCCAIQDFKIDKNLSAGFSISHPVRRDRLSCRGQLFSTATSRDGVPGVRLVRPTRAFV